jgi:hypothetical protein
MSRYYPPPNAPTWGNANAERLLSEALQANTAPGALLADSIRPPLPQVQLFPPRFGYRQGELGILDVIYMSRYYPDRRDAWTGGPNDYAATARPALGWL